MLNIPNIKKEVIQIKRLVILPILLLTLIIIILFNILLIKDLNTLNHTLQIDNTNNYKSKYKLALIYQTDEKYNELITRGASQVASVNNINLKVYTTKPFEQFTIKDYTKLLLLSDFDGLIIDGEDPELAPLINKASQNEIPVVTIISDLPETERISYVGTNNHRTGYISGRTMLNKLNNLKPKLAIITIDYNDEKYTPTADYLKIFGFREAISSNPESNIISWEKTTPNRLETQQLIINLLKKHPSINGLYTIDTTTTLAAASIKENYNKDFILIGYGDNNEICQYLKKGIIDASISFDPYQIGYNSVREIFSYLEEKKTNLYSNIDIRLVTPYNYSTLLKNSGE